MRGFDIVIGEGEIVGVAGPSGCGKTTLARLLAGYDASDEGEVLLDGRPLPPSGFCPVQLVFQHPEKAVNPRLRIRSIINEGWETDRAFRRKLGIAEEWLNRFPGELSGGELQRVCVARALGPQTRYLIADEMTAMLDAITAAQLWHAVLELANERRLGIMVVSHERKLLERLCTRIVSKTSVDAPQE